ncbi:UNVERIFIED_CONTAM: hypothetical protein PYX00_011034 [Menopon gallinae]|uniref:CCHC-type domain-containing protein n=1 Tax=Menopon gallinae TaxID=328185 RepID=A0AAW2H6G1_9NEOP
MNSINSVRLDLLNKDNFDTWKIQMKAILVKNGLWKYVNGTLKCPEVTDGDAEGAGKRESWIDFDEKAKADIILSISPTELKLIKNCETSREIWTKLEETYESKGPARKAALLKQLILIKMEDPCDVREHCRRFFDIVDRLEEMDIKIHEDLLSIMLLYSLPENFENFRFESRDELPKLEALRIKIIEEGDARRKGCSSEVPGAMVTSKENKGQGDSTRNGKKCYRCNKVGHMAKNCHVNLKNKNKINNNSVSLYSEPEAANVSARDDLWCLDSGSTSHICNTPHKIQNLEQSGTKRLRVANGQTTEICGSGTVKIKTGNCNNKNVAINNVLLVPELKMNFLSVSKITDKGLDIMFSKRNAKIMDRNGRVLLKGERRGDLYFVKEAGMYSSSTDNSDSFYKENSRSTDCPILHEEVRADDGEDRRSDKSEITVHQEKGRAAGRPRLLRTGKRGRPRKIYHQVNEADVSAEREEWAMTGEISVEEALSGSNSEEWMDAIVDETKSILKNNTWEMVDRKVSDNVIGSRYVLRNKYNADGSIQKRKARLVAKGFSQRPHIDFNDTFSPVARMKTVRLLTAISARSDFKVHQLYITTAFLKGDLNERVLMRPPKFIDKALENITKRESKDSPNFKSASRMLADMSKGKDICALRKSLYGLKQESRQWYLKLSEKLKAFGAIPSSYDPCLYYKREGNELILIPTYVDDIILASSNLNLINDFKKYLSSCFDTKDLGEIKHFLGIEFCRDEFGFKLSQRGYIDELLRRFDMGESKPVSTPMEVNLKMEKSQTPCFRKFRELVGSLMYLAVCTRPDISYSVSALSQFDDCFGEEHWKAGKRFKKPRTVALSSTEAEYMAMTEATKECIYLNGIKHEMGFTACARNTIHADNQVTKRLSESETFHSRTKHIDIRHHFIKEAVADGRVRFQYCPTEEMLADIFTKSLARERHEKLVMLLGIHAV